MNVSRRALLGGVAGSALFAGSAPAILFSGASVAGGNVDGFNNGIWFPSTLTVSNNSDVGNPIASGFARGFTGVQSWSLSGADAASFSLKNTTLFTGIGVYFSGQPSFSITVNATDGVTTRSQNVLITNQRNCAFLGSNVLLDTSPIGWAGHPSTDALYVGTVSNSDGDPSRGGPGIQSSTVFQYGTRFDGGFLATTDAEYPLSSNYGTKSVTITSDDYQGNPQTFPTSIWFITELAPEIIFTPSVSLYDNFPVGWQFGTATAFSDAGIQQISINDSNNFFGIGDTGGVVSIASLVAGSYSFTLTAISTSGKTTSLVVNYSVGVGTNLSTSDMTVSFSGSLNNSETNVAVGTAAISGLSGTPAWTLELVNNDAQSATLFSGAANPKYTFTGQGTTTITVTAAYLSAQTDSMILTVNNGAGTQCRKTISLAAAAVSGPALTVNAADPNTPPNFLSWNSAMDAYWTTPASYYGCTVTLSQQDFSNDFNRTEIGHGSNQQWPPGPYTLQGASPSSPIVIDFLGLARGTGQGGLYAQGGDITMQNLLVKGCSNIASGEGNAGAIYKTNQLPYNLTLTDTKMYNSDNGLLNGDLGCFLTATRCIFAMCGIGAGGLTHNAYCGHYSGIDIESCLSFSTAQVHEFKTRAGRGTINNSIFADGENGAPGGSGVLDMPVGGNYSITNTVFHKGPNPNNDPALVQFCAESTNGGPNQLWADNEVVIDGCYFINCIPPGVFSAGNGTGFVFWQMPDGTPTRSPFNGLPAKATIKNCKFYGFASSADWWVTQNVLNVITDGGGNSAITTWPTSVMPYIAQDPSTSANLNITNLNPFYAVEDQSFATDPSLTIPPNILAIHIAASSSIGTAVVTPTGYDGYGIALTSPTWSLLNNDSGNFAINSSTGAITVANASIADGLRFIEVQVVGIPSVGSPITLSKWLFIVVGTGAI